MASINSQLLITHLTFTPKGGEPSKVGLAQVTALIGPNGVGKTRALEAIKNAASGSGRAGIRDLNIEISVDTTASQPEAVERLSKLLRFESENRNYWFQDASLGRVGDTQIPPLDFAHRRTRLTQEWLEFRTHYSTATSRLQLLADSNASTSDTLLSRNPGFLAKLIANRATFSRVNEPIRDAFGYWLVTDTSNFPRVSLRLCPEKPPDDLVREDGVFLGRENRKYFERQWELKNTSHGTQSFVALVADIIQRENQLLLLDEPEVSLSPGLQWRAGRVISDLARKGQSQIIYSTHSPRLLEGSISLGPTLQVLRLCNEGGTLKVRALPTEELQRIAADPLLRNTSVMNALFHSGAILVEEASGAVLYEECMRRILAADPTAAYDATFVALFGNARIPEVCKKLRAFGVKTAVVVDLDILNDGAGLWTALLEAAGIEDTLLKNLQTDRAACWQALSKVRPQKGDAGCEAPQTKWGAVPNSGVRALKDGDLKALERLLATLRDFGIFVVPVGELEQWFGGLGIDRAKTEFLANVLTQIERKDLGPKNDDDPIWSFLSDVRQWLNR